MLGSLILALWMTGPALAANPLLPGSSKSAAATSAAATDVPEIAAEDVPARADDDERWVSELSVRARQKDPAAKLAPRLDQLARGIEDLSRDVGREDLEELSALRLSSLQGHWRFYERKLTEWRRDLERNSAPYSADAAALAKRRTVWEATRTSLEAIGVAPALIDRANNILAQIDIAERALSVPLDRQIKLGRRANSIETRIDAGHAKVDAAMDYHDRRLTMIDAPPIWDVWRDRRVVEDDSGRVAAGLRIENAFAKEWAALNAQRLLAYEITALVLLPLLLWLAWRSRGIVATDPGTQAAARVLRRPISAWLVVAFVGQPFFFPDAPLLLVQISLLVAVVPVLRLLPPKAFELLGRWPYITTTLYVAYKLRFPLLENTLHYRLYLLGLAIVSAATLVWLLVDAGRVDRNVVGWRLRTVVRAVGWLAVAALLAAIGANVIGNTSLAEMLTGAVMESGYVGLALYSAAHVLASVLNLLLARRAVNRFSVITQHAGPLLASLSKLIMVGAFVSWLIVVANEFRVGRPVYSGLKRVLTYPIEAGQLSVTLGSVLLFLGAIWVAFWIARTLRLVLSEDVLPNMALPRGVANSVATLSYYAIVLIGVLVALAAAGFETSQFAIVFGALGIGIGLGLQSVVNNFVSGLILMFERPIQPGDVVEISGTSGKVRDIGMRATTLTTFEGADVVVPNGTLLSEKLINWTLSDMNRRIDVEVGVAYGTDPRRILELLREVAENTPGIVADPIPSVVFKGFGPNSLDFGIRSWTHDFGDWVAIRTEMTARVYEALRREGVAIPFPQHDINLRTISPEVASQLAEGVVSVRTRSQPATEC